MIVLNRCVPASPPTVVVVVERLRTRGWSVAAEGSGWLISTHNTEGAAVAAARRVVATQGGGVIVHGYGASAPYLHETVEA